MTGLEGSLIVAILSFIVTLIAVMTPIIKLNSTITKLNATIDNLDKTVSESKLDLKKQSEKIQDHELRIDRLEHKGEINTKRGE